MDLRPLRLASRKERLKQILPSDTEHVNRIAGILIPASNLEQMKRLFRALGKGRPPFQGLVHKDPSSRHLHTPLLAEVREEATADVFVMNTIQHVDTGEVSYSVGC